MKLALAVLMILPWLAAIRVTAATNAPAALLVSLQGRVELQRSGGTTWERAATNVPLQAKDRLRTGPRSRATLQLSNLSVQRLDELSTIEVQPDDKAQAGFQMELREGGLYFFNREKPVEQRFKTPVASGAILGTEFALRVAPDGRTWVSLMDGRIELAGIGGGDAMSLVAGEAAEVGAGEPPRKTPAIDLVGAVQWCLYYPGVVDPNEIGLSTGDRGVLTESIRAYRAGDLLGAVSALPPGYAPVEPSERLYVAGVLLAAGQSDAALAMLRGLDSEVAISLRSLIAAVQGRAQPSGFGGPLATTLLAGSYASQAAGNLDEALARAVLATRRSPDFGFAWARLAELEFGHGRIARAQSTLDRAIALAPRNAQAVALRGFVLAGQNRMTEAQRAFDEAITLDGSLANGWLGRGLCRIRTGDLEAGRADLQVAAATEPTRSVLRSYLGKAWAESGDLRRSDEEIRRARELDPGDPTSWFYSALLNQRRNRVSEAVDELEESRRLNDNRAVYRSRLLLDQDRAMRSANLAGVYGDAGLVDRSLREAGRAVADDYGNASAHQFLADSYYARRDPRKFNLRYETPWLSELLVAQLLAPVGGGSLSQYVSQNEYSKLFERDRFGFRSSTEYGSAGDWHEVASQFGTLGGLSYAFDVDYRTEAGFVPNTDTRQESFYGKLKQQFTASDTGFVMVNQNEYDGGDTRQYYDPANPRTGASQGFRSEERQAPNVFLGWHHEWAPGQHTLFLAGHLDGSIGYSDTNSVIPVVSRPAPGSAETAVLTRVFDVDYRRELEAWSTELQHIAVLNSHTLVAGLRYQVGDVETSGGQALHNGRLQFPGPDVFPQATQQSITELQRFSAYLYDTWRVFGIESLRLTAGVGYDRVTHPRNADFLPLDAGERETDRFSPKLGLTWSPREETHFRAAWTRSLGGLYYDTSVRLEPVQVSGFGQAFRSLVPESVAGLTPGSRFETFGVGVDHRFPTRTYVDVSGELLRSEAMQGFGAYDWARTGRLVALPVTLDRELEFEERTVSVAIHQLLGRHWALGVNYRASVAELDTRYPGLKAGVANDPTASNSAAMHQVGGLAKFFLDCGFFAEAQALWTRQANRGYTPDLPGDDFWQFHFFLGQRFLNRRAEVRVGVLNLGNQDYRLNPLNLHDEYPRERTFYAGLRLYF